MTPPGSDNLDWLANLRGADRDEPWQGESAEENQGSRTPGGPEEDDVPEWLERIRRRSMEDRALQEMQTPPLEDRPDEQSLSSPDKEGDLPDWLKISEEPQPPFPSPEESEPLGEEIDHAGQTAPTGTGETPFPADLGEFDLGMEETSPSGEAPDWLEQLKAEKSQAEFDTGELDLPLDLEGKETPVDSGTGMSEGEEIDFEAAPEFLEQAGIEDFTTEFPDWIEESTPEGGDSDFLEKPDKSLPDFSATEDIGMKEDIGFPPVEQLPAEAQPETTRQTEIDRAAAPPRRDADIEPARLPGWLEAIKPIESVAPARFSAEADNQTESRGPLAGFQGIIPGSYPVTKYPKSAVPALKMQVTEKQRVYANLLENLISEEAKPLQRKVEKAAAPSELLRFFVGIALVGLLAFMLFSGIQLGSLPGLYSPDTVAFFNTIQQFSQVQNPPARILVAVDYEPALAGEMQTAARTPLRQMLASGGQLIMVSTVPAGPALGEQLVADAATDLPVFQPDLQVVNLGYLVGGSTSLASLAAQPSIAAPALTSGSPAWDLPLLQGIQSVADFDGLLLMTDNAETARAWIEQVQPSLAGKPLLIISSAQSAPIILPYYQSNQVQGMLAGLSGSAAYEQLAQIGASKTSSLWGAYQAGILFVLGAILLGGLVYGIRALFHNFSRKRA